jgi:MFS family permease
VDSGRAWAAVAGAFFASAVALGVIYSFGVFLRPITVDLRASSASVSAFFSITSLVYYALGAPAGRLADRYGPRPIIASGAVILAAGLCATAFVDNVWLACLTYAVGAGLGGACCYVPSLAVIGGWFVRHRNMALGVAAAGRRDPDRPRCCAHAPLSCCISPGYSRPRRCLYRSSFCLPLPARMAPARSPPPP